MRDPRWGRGYETAGEDALVNARFATQFVLGLQGERTTGNSYLKVLTLATAVLTLLVLPHITLILLLLGTLIHKRVLHNMADSMRAY